MREGGRERLQMCDGDVERSPWLRRWISLWYLLGTAARGLGGPGEASPRQDGDARSHRSPTELEVAEGAAGCWGASSPRASGGVGTARWGDAVAGRWGCGRAGGAGLSPGAGGGCRWRGVGCCRAAINQRQLYQARPRLRGVNQDLNKTEDFSARSGLPVGIRSGDSVATGRPRVPASSVKGV